MLKVVSNKLKEASLPSDVQLQLTSVEEDIFGLIREASQRMPKRPTARVAGGWVRDKLLGKPSKDIDVTVDNMKGVEFGELLRQYAIAKWGPSQNVVSRVQDTEARPDQIKNLAVAFLRIYGQDVEILNLRGNEVYEEGSRNPVSVSEATPEQDAFRRDLTINSLFYNINTGRIEDFTGRGYDDLATLTLRTPLEPFKTFTDDPLRALRVLRFYSRYPGSKIAPEVVEALKNPDVQFQITRRIANPAETRGIVVERTAEELRKLMKGAQPEKAVRIMYETGLLGKILNLPASHEPLDMDQRNRWHQLSIIDHSIEVLGNVNRLSKEYGLPDDERMMMNISALVHDLGKLDPRSHKNKPDGTRGYSGDPNNPQGIPHETASFDVWSSFANALKFSNEERDWIGELVSGHMRPHSHVEDEGPSISDRSLRRYKRKNPNWMFQYIHAMADAMSKNTLRDESLTEPYKANMDRLRALELAPQMGPATDLLNGNEIIQLVDPTMRQYSPKTGYIEAVKERIREEQDTNPALSKDQAAEILRNMVASGELNAYQNPNGV